MRINLFRESIRENRDEGAQQKRTGEREGTQPVLDSVSQ